MNRIIAKLIRERNLIERRYAVTERAYDRQPKSARRCLGLTRRSQLAQIMALTLAIDTLRQVKEPQVLTHGR